MRQGLQYLYSFFVFFGVLATAYYMMNKEVANLEAQRSIPSPSNSFRYEAGVGSTAGVNQLFQFENQLSQVPLNVEPRAKRVPSDTKSKKKITEQN